MLDTLTPEKTIINETCNHRKKSRSRCNICNIHTSRYINFWPSKTATRTEIFQSGKVFIDFEKGTNF